jgi:UDP-3-O-[3-hydroxymyristoyl] glucosamine N-acyltransferase
MHLSKLSTINSIKIIKDGEFYSLGLLSHHQPKMLVTLYDASYTKKLITNKHISCVLTTKDLAKGLSDKFALGVCDDPMRSFYAIHSYLSTNTNFYGKNFDTDISPKSSIHETAFISSQNVRIGDFSIIEPHVTVLENTTIGRNVIIRAGSVIGGTGMEAKLIDNKLINIHHSGGVKIHDYVEICGNSYIQRSVFGNNTEIGSETKIGPMVNIGHNVKIGCQCEIAGGSVISGSTIIDNNVWIGPNSTLASEIHIGNNAYISLGSTVTINVKHGQKVAGIFAMDKTKALRGYALIRSKT